METVLSEVANLIQQFGAFVALGLSLVFVVHSVRTGRTLRRLERLHHEPSGRPVGKRRMRHLRRRQSEPEAEGLHAVGHVESHLTAPAPDAASTHPA